MLILYVSVIYIKRFQPQKPPVIGIHQGESQRWLHKFQTCGRFPSGISSSSDTSCQSMQGCRIVRGAFMGQPRGTNPRLVHIKVDLGGCCTSIFHFCLPVGWTGPLFSPIVKRLLDVCVWYAYSPDHPDISCPSFVTLGNRTHALRVACSLMEYSARLARSSYSTQ